MIINCYGSSRPPYTCYILQKSMFDKYYGFYCSDAAKSDPYRKVVVCSDTDVLLMLFHHFQNLCLRIIIWVGRGTYKRDFDVGKSFEALNYSKAENKKLKNAYFINWNCDDVMIWIIYNPVNTQPKPKVHKTFVSWRSYEHPVNLQFESCVHWDRNFLYTRFFL